MDKWSWMLLGVVLGAGLSLVRNKTMSSSAKAEPVAVATPLGYDQHNGGFENRMFNWPPVGQNLGYFGIFPSGA